MLRCFALLLFAYGAVGYGYDSGGGDQASCGRPYRTGRNYQPPCDLSKHGYCNDAGELYPWRAVRRFVKDNQGLMRRMYGDQRQAHLLRIELDPDIFDEEWGQPTRNFNEWREPYHKRYSRHQQEDELDIENELSPMLDEDSLYLEENPYGESRYLRDDSNSVADVLKTKFIYSQHEPAVLIKLAGLKSPSRYRATTQRTTTATPKTPTTERTTPTTTNKSTTTKPNSTFRTFPPRNTNPKKIYSARNTASTFSTTRRSTSFRTTTSRTTTTTSKSNTTAENKQSTTTTPSTNTTAKNKPETDSSTVATSKKPVYITRDSAVTNKIGNGKNDGATTEALTTDSTTFSATGTTTTTEISELTTDTTASLEHLSSKQPTTTTHKAKPTNQTYSSPLNSPIERIGDDDTIEILSEKNTSAEKFVFNDKKVNVLKNESERFEDLKYNNNQNDNTNTKDNNAEEFTSDEKETSAEISEEDNENHKDNINTDTNDNDSDSDAEDSEVDGSETYVHKVKAPESVNTPVNTMLFQDMEDNTDKKVTVDFNQKGVNACPVKEEVVAPFWANNTRGEVLALLNMYPFEQYVHWEKCTFEHRQMYCREGCRCEQQYRLHRLLAYDPSNECRGIFSDWFRFPSCCVCKCYNIPAEFRVTSRSPRLQRTFNEEELDYDDQIT